MCKYVCALRATVCVEDVWVIIPTIMLNTVFHFRMKIDIIWKSLSLHACVCVPFKLYITRNPRS